MPKDACYHKVKARYKVFPSAYASGAIAKCRKVGAANYGNKSKKKADGGIMENKPSSKHLMEKFTEKEKQKIHESQEVVVMS